MKKYLFAYLAIFTFTAYADQKLFPIENSSLTLENKTLIASGEVRGKEIRGKIHSFGILGKVDGQECGTHFCRGTLSINIKKDVILNAKIDKNLDGNVDSTESMVVGRLVGDIILFDVPVIYTYVVQRYSLMERMTGLRNSKYISASIKLD